MNNRLSRWTTSEVNERRIGYARVSSAHQSLDRQIAALRAENCDVIFREKASGKSLKGGPKQRDAQLLHHQFAGKAARVLDDDDAHAVALGVVEQRREALAALDRVGTADGLVVGLAVRAMKKQLAAK